VLALAPLLGLLPMAALAALLLQVAWNMSEAKHFMHTLQVAPRSDVAVLLTCFGLTVFTDMVIGVSVGIVLAAMLFMRRMAAVTQTQLVERADPTLPGPVPPGVVVYRVSGPLFFGAAQRAMAALHVIADRARVVVLQLEQVPVLDATGLVALESALGQLRSSGVTAILLGLQPQPRALVERTGLLEQPGVLSSSDAAEALRLAAEIAGRGQSALGAIPADLTAADAMRKDVTAVGKQARLREVVESMLVHGHRSLPVVDRGAVIGIITNGDLVQRGGLGVRIELLRGLAWTDVRAELDALAGASKTAADVMTAAPVTITTTLPLRRAAALMAKRRLKRLPVVDERGRLAGMLSRVDLLRAAAGLARPGEEVPAATGAGGGTTVAQVMRRDIPAVLPDMPLAEVLQAVISTRLNKALVVDGERRVLGLITDAELIDRMTRSLRPGLLRSLMQRVPFAHIAPEDQLVAQHARARRAADLMVTGVPTVTLDTPIGAATAAMLKADRKILAVLDAEGRLAGIVDRADLLRGLASPAEGGGTPAPLPARNA